MIRDLDLCRQILFALEDGSLGSDPNNIAIEGFDNVQQIAYHCHLLIEAGLVRGDIMESGGYGVPPDARPYGLTWAGHEFLDSARPQSRWDEARTIIGKIGGASLQIWIKVLREQAEQAVRDLIS